MKLYRLSRVEYSSTRGEWPGEEVTDEADENGEQLMCVSHSSPWMSIAMRANTSKDSKSASSLLHLFMPLQCMYPAEHTVSVCRYTPPMSPTLSDIKAQHLGPVDSLEVNAGEHVTYLPPPRPHQS